MKTRDYFSLLEYLGRILNDCLFPVKNVAGTSKELNNWRNNINQSPRKSRIVKKYFNGLLTSLDTENLHQCATLIS